MVGWMAVGCESSTPPASPTPGPTQAAAPDQTSDGETSASGSVAATKYSTDPSASDASAVELKLLDYDGIQKLIAGHRGKVVVMDAWSTSCLPCLKEFPKLVELQERVGRADLACVSLSLDYEGLGKPADEIERVLKFLMARKATFDNVLSTNAADDLYRRFQLASIPAVFVYDRQGQLRKRFDNEKASSSTDVFSYEQVEQLVAELVNEKP
jgi:thiol-disulfide isomerase/thioredoxin